MEPDKQSSPNNDSLNLPDQVAYQPPEVVSPVVAPVVETINAKADSAGPAPASQIAQPAQPTVSGSLGLDQPTPTQPSPPVAKKAKGIKKIGMIPAIIIVVILLLGATAAAYVGVVVPNKPENVWKTAMTNTSKGLDRLITYTKGQKDIKGAKAKGNFKVETEGIVVDGTFEGAYYEKNSKLQADIGAAGSRVKLDMLTHVPEGADTPDVYARVNGLSGLSSVLGATDPKASKLLASIDNQWYVLDHTIFDQVQSSLAKSKDKTPELSAEDVYAIQGAITKVSKDYLFSTDEGKSVLKVNTFVGTEKVDGRKLYHYKVGINKENAKKFATALKDELKNTKLGEMYKDPSFEESTGFNEIIKSIDSDLKEDETVDVWVDGSTKLVRKVSITDDKEKSRVEFSLNYNGGDIYPFVIGLYSDNEKDKGSVVLNLDLNTVSNTVSMKMAADMGSQGKAAVEVGVEKNDSPVEFTKPNDAKSIYELLGGSLSPALGGGIPTTVLGESTFSQLIQ